MHILKDIASKTVSNKLICKKEKIMRKKLDKSQLEKIHKYWNASNFLSATQLYLLDNPLLETPLCQSDVKGRLAGPWGTAPGQNFVYVHLNRAINQHNIDVVLLSGPGHGGIFWTANTYLDGSMGEKYPEITFDKAGLQKLNKQFCFPYGVSSHVAPEMVGSMHEGGELGYVLSHAFGAVLDNPNLIAVAIVGDGEAETGPLATSWHGNKFLNPITDGAVLPILHLNGFKVFNPTVLARIPRDELEMFFKGHGWKPYFVEGSDPMQMHQKMAEVMDDVVAEIKSIWAKARKKNDATRPIWPMIVLRTPKGWTCPKIVDDLECEGTHNAYHMPYSMKRPEHLAQLETWLKSYNIDDFFDKDGKFRDELQALAPKGDKRIGASIYANGGALLKELKLPDFKKYAVNVKKFGDRHNQDTTVLSKFMRDIIKKNPQNYRIFCPDEMASNRMGAVYEVTNNVLNAEIYKNDESIARSGRVMDAYLSEHMCEGWAEGYILTGRHATFVSYAAFIRVVDSMISQHAKWLKMSSEVKWREPISSLNLVLTSHAWQQDHNGYSHQEPGLFDHLVNKKGHLIGTYLPPDANCLLATYDKVLRTKNKINAIVTSKQPSWQWLNIDQAIKHCQKGLGVWQEVSNNPENPDVIIACAGDVITFETVAGASILKKYLPSLNFRFINIVDLMTLANPDRHPSGLKDSEFNKLFTTDKPIVFNYHGYPSLIHELTWKRQNRNLYVSGYIEEGRISTPFDIRVQNKVDRFNFVKSVLGVLPQTDEVKELKSLMDKKLALHKRHIKKLGTDLPEVANWQAE